MKHPSWGPSVCLDCRAVGVTYCETCTLARQRIGKRIKRSAYNAYQREYQRRARMGAEKGPKMRDGGRERSRRFRERKRLDAE